MLQALDTFVADRVSAHRAYTPEGYLIALGVPIARTGSQIYKADEIDKTGILHLTGRVDVFRPASEVFKPSALRSFEGKSVVSPHPPQFLNSDNDATYAKGHAQNVRKGFHPETGDEVVLADLVVKDKTLIHQIEDGHRMEISAGYTYDLDRADDEYSENSRFEQRNICGNHIAIVPSGRAGSDIRVLDASLEEGDKNMAEGVQGIAEKPGMLAELATFCKTLGLRLTTSDEDPGAVERNKQKMEEALKLKSRIMDEKDEEMEKEDKKAKPPKAESQGKDEKTKDADEEESKKKEEARDAKLDRLIDGIERLVAKDAKKCTCDAEEGAAHKKNCAMYKEEGEDADLIPIHRLHGDEIPKNPIPGADAALTELRKIRPLIAQSGDKQAIDAYNRTVRQLKDSLAEDAGDGGYGDLLRTQKPEKVVTDELKAGIHGQDHKTDRENAPSDFEAAAKKFHRINASEAKKA